jgi:hypothetical protein
VLAIDENVGDGPLPSDLKQCVLNFVTVVHFIELVNAILNLQISDGILRL